MSERIPKELSRALASAAMGKTQEAVQELQGLALKLDGDPLRWLSLLLDDLPENPSFDLLWPRLGKLREVFSGDNPCAPPPAAAGSGSPMSSPNPSPVPLAPPSAAGAPASSVPSAYAAAAPGSTVAPQPPAPTSSIAPSPPPAPAAKPAAPRLAPRTAVPVPFPWKPPELGEDTIRSYFSEATECLDLVAQLVASMETGSEGEMAEVYRKLHTVKGSSGMFGLRPVEALVHTMEDLVRALRAKEMPWTDDARLLIARGVVTARDAVIEAQRNQLVTVDVNPISDEFREFLASGGSAGAAPVEPAASAGGGVRSAGAETPATAPATAPAAAPTTAPATAPATAASKPAAPAPKPQSTRSDAPKSLETMQLRVEFAKVDHLASMVGEQTMQQEEVGRHLNRMQEAIEEMYRTLLAGGDSPNLDTESAGTYLRQATRNLNLLASSLESKTQQLDLTSNKIQGMVLDLRMTRIGDLFQKHSLTVMTAAAAQGKKAKLVIEGGETRLDKSIVEKLDEPLLHLIRNAVSHGIGTPAARQAKGKAPDGKVTVRAFQRGNHVIVQVEDDGEGIDPTIIRRKAVEKGFLTQEEAALMDDSRIVDLIFAPGFSTTNVVNDISGRGVGLDAVRNEINRINGAVQLQSRLGEGTTFELVLPLTLALSRMLLVEVAGETVAIPADNVNRVSSLSASGVVRMEGRYLARLGEETVPLVFLDRSLGLSTLPVVRRDYTVCLVSHGTQSAALVVDRTVDYMQAVIRDVGPMLPRVKHCMGVTFFEGDCVLILDPGALVRGWHESTLLPSVSMKPARAAVLTNAPERFAELHRISRRWPLRVALVDPAAFKPEMFPQVHQIWIDGLMEDLEEHLSALALASTHYEVILWTTSEQLAALDKVALYRAGIQDVVVGEHLRELIERVRASERKEGAS